METPAEREARVARLEAGRAKRRANGMGTVWPTPDDAGLGVIPIEVAPGRGDLNYSSGFVPTIPTALRLVDRKVVSFARVFQSQPWVAAAVMRMLTWAVRVPLKCYHRQGDPNERIPVHPGDHPVADFIYNPWPGGDMAHLVMQLLGPVLVHGNSVTEIDDTNNSGKIGLTAKDWRYCQPIMPWRDSLEGFRFDVDTPKFQHDVTIDKVLHVAWWSPVGPLGTSPLMQLGITLNIEDAAQRYQMSTFRHGGRPASAIVASEEFLGIDPVERRTIMAQLRDDVTNLYGGPENATRPALLPPGLDWKGIAHTNMEAQLIDQRKVAREEVAAVYLIPPPLLGILDRATYSNIGIQREMTYTDCLGPPLILIEQAINGQIIRDLMQDDEIFVEFDFGAVLRGDRLAEINAIRQAVSGGLMMPNEGRAILNLPQVTDQPGMDDIWVPSNNMEPISLAVKGPPPPPPALASDDGGEPVDDDQTDENSPPPGQQDTTDAPGQDDQRGDADFDREFQATFVHPNLP